MRKGTRSSLVTPLEMKNEKVVIKKVHKAFRSKYVAYAKRKMGLVNNNDIDKLINKAVEKVPMTQAQEEIVQGFYDTYLGALYAGGSDLAETFAKSIFE